MGRFINEGVCIGVVVVIILAVIGSLIWAITPTLDLRRPIPKYNAADIVKMTLSGDRGMIVSVRCGKGSKVCSYNVRFSSLQMSTNVSLFGSDGPINIAPVALVRYIREFELERENDDG